MSRIRSTLPASALAATLGLSLAGPASAGRLFGTGAGLSNIVELDPVTGQVINTLAGPTGWVQDGLAYDGTALWYLGADANTLYRLNPDTGQTLNSYALPEPDPDPEGTDSGARGGLAFLNGLIYITNWDFQVQDIEVFDPAVGQVVNVLDIDGSNPANTRRFGNSGFAAVTGPDLLVVNTALSQEVQFIDPETGVITASFGHDQFGVQGIAVVDGELYLGSDEVGSDDDGIEAVHVYSRDGTALRTFNIDGVTGIHSLAGDETAVPEPASMTLLALGSVVLLRRRRRV